MVVVVAGGATGEIQTTPDPELQTPSLHVLVKLPVERMKPLLHAIAHV